MLEHSNAAMPQTPCPADSEVRAELERILSSSCFQASEKRRRFLRFVVEETLAGRANRLKGYTVAVEVFERAEDFDPQIDPVVRLEARRLRRDLDGYYAADGRDNPLHISIPKGQYAPEFTVLDTGNADHRTEHPTPEDIDASDAAKPETKNEAANGRKSPSIVRWMMASLLLCALVIVTLGYELFKDRVQKPAQTKTAHGPSLIVLPFEQRDNGPATAFLANGLTDEIMAEFDHYPDIRLYMDPALFEKQAMANIVRMADKSGVEFLVSGSVSSDASMIRVNAKLIHVATDQVLWTETYDSPQSPPSLMKTQKQIAENVASTLGQPYGIIRTFETDKLLDSHARSETSYECILQAYSYRRSFAANLRAPVLACLKEAVQRDPGYPEAWAMLGWLYMDSGRFEWAPDSPEKAYDRALSAASHAIVLEGKNVLALKVLAAVNHYMGNYEESVRLQRRALELNPNDPDTMEQLGWRLAIRGNFEEGIPYLQKAIDLTVSPPGWFYHLIAIDHYMNGRYTEMLTAAKNGVVDELPTSWALVAIAQGALGNKAAAQTALAKMTQASPLMARDPGTFLRRHQATDEIVNAFIAGMRKAGWTEPGAG
ncbi:hypothetical protein [uncultured Roseibium sp.]|uniref:hypothetical protein n=1 Tax=uncultured Roseibium sp. TaxID=1936171 RepID=UPI0032167013